MAVKRNITKAHRKERNALRSTMAEQKTLEDLRQKIMASMGKRPAEKASADGEETAAKRQKGGVLPSGPQRGKVISDNSMEKGAVDRFARPSNYDPNNSGNGGRRMDPRRSNRPPLPSGPQIPPSVSQQPQRFNNGRQGYNSGSQAYNNDRNQQYDSTRQYLPQGSYDQPMNTNAHRRRARTNGDTRVVNYRNYHQEGKGNINRNYNNNNSNRNYNRNINTTNNNNANNSISSRNHQKPANYIPPAFRDVNRYKNITRSRLNCQIIVRYGQGSFQGNDKEDRLKQCIESLLQRSDLLNKKEKTMTNITVDVHDAYSILGFSLFKFTTIAMSGRSIINKVLGIPLQWCRPNSYVEQCDHMVKICGSNVIALENMPANSERDEKLQDIFGRDTYDTHDLTVECKDDAQQDKCMLPSCIVVLKNGDITEKVRSALDRLGSPWFEPNKSPFGLGQRTTRLLLSDMIQLAQAPVNIPAKSQTLVLLNCVDPMDLKDPDFVSEVHDTLAASFRDVDTVHIMTPNSDYRLTMDHVNEHIGNIYMKFHSELAARTALETVQGAQFNGRTVIASLVDTGDHDTPGLLWN